MPAEWTRVVVVPLYRKGVPSNVSCLLWVSFMRDLFCPSCPPGCQPRGSQVWNKPASTKGPQLRIIVLFCTHPPLALGRLRLGALCGGRSDDGRLSGGPLPSLDWGSPASALCSRWPNPGSWHCLSGWPRKGRADVLGAR